MENPLVLIIDDEEELVTTLVERLQWRGIPAEGFTAGGPALSRMREVPFDVVVVDLKMPGLDGLDLLGIVNRDYPEVTVILITGHGSDQEGGQAIPAGASEVLLKPFKIDALIDCIQRAGEKRGEGQ